MWDFGREAVEELCMLLLCNPRGTREMEAVSVREE